MSILKEFIVVKGAREHNLKNVDISIPRNQLVTITGPSGSGKSSLAFDTIYAEGQRRYVESLSTYARQFLQVMKKPDVDNIEGLSPAISIEQKTVANNPRSTVATITELYDYLRLLFSRVGTPYSPATKKPIIAYTVDQILETIFAYPANTKLLLMAPYVKNQKGGWKKIFQDIREKGFLRIKLGKKHCDLDNVPAVSAQKGHDLSIVVDRIAIPEEIDAEFRMRVTSSIETILELSNGLVEVEDHQTGELISLSSRFSCPESGFVFPEIEPKLFSFNNVQGACPQCQGLGYYEIADIKELLEDETRTFTQGPFKHIRKDIYTNWIRKLATKIKFTMSQRWGDLTPNQQSFLLNGDDKFPGLLELLRMTHDDEIRWERLVNHDRKACTYCNGYRLKPEPLQIKIQGIHIGQVTDMSISEAYEWIEKLPFEGQKKEISETIVKEIRDRLHFLNAVGLGYLTLNRISGTLSGGESQRIRLASQIGSRLTGVMYVLDEPSIGLHQRDNDRLIDTLKELRDLGNTIIVVEHDEDFMRSSDYLIDIGPHSGAHGGKVVAQGTPKEVQQNPNSMTGRYLSGQEEIPVPATRRKARGQLTLKGATHNNLKNIDVDFPIGCFVAVTGVSGSGKSSLVMQTLRFCQGPQRDLKGIKGLEQIDSIIDIDQTPIGRTPRSNPATYIGVFTHIRDWFACLPESRNRGYLPGRFSFNVKGGRCEACQGDGVVRTSMHFMADVFTTCDHCQGKRFTQETLGIKYDGLSIYDVLELTVDQAVEKFKFMDRVTDKLKTLQMVGLGYIKLGQSSTTLSGGEAQRVKLAKELSKRSTGRSLYILDEPTTGLHFNDIRKLLEILHTLVKQGNTVVVIEHNLDVVKTADWVIDLGPEGGQHGGLVVAEGTPEQLVKSKKSLTGQYLAKLLKKSTQKLK